MVKYHTFDTKAAAEAKLDAIRAKGGSGYILTMRYDWHEVREVGIGLNLPKARATRQAQQAGSTITID